VNLPRHVVTKASVLEVSQRLRASPHEPLPKLEQHTEISHSSCGRAAKTLQLFPYKVNIFQ
jgi:hypothetical protein